MTRPIFSHDPDGVFPSHSTRNILREGGVEKTVAGKNIPIQSIVPQGILPDCLPGALSFDGKADFSDIGPSLRIRDVNPDWI